MVPYIFLFLLLTTFSCSGFFFIRSIKFQTQSRLLDKSIQNYKKQEVKFANEKIQYIQKIEQYLERSKYQEKIIHNFEKLQIDSQELTKGALFDLGHKLSKQLIAIHKQENEETRKISEKRIAETAKKFNSDFERIVSMVTSLNKEIEQSKDIVDVIKNSLLSPSGAGALAEITLENIMKSSGLRLNTDYLMQYSVYNEHNHNLRPDAVVFLPSNRLMIIDAKASKFLVNEINLAPLAKTMNLHLRSLSNKLYVNAVKQSLRSQQVNIGHIVTLMFLPTDHAIEKLCEADNDFMSKAWKCNIFPVGPAGLMNMLSFAKFQISEEMTAHNHQKIITEVQKLITSIGSMIEHSRRLGTSITSVVSHYDKFAGSFNRNFLSKVHNISKMGIAGGLKKSQTPLQRLQVITSSSESADEVNLDES